MIKSMRKMLAVGLSALMLCSIVPVSTFAAPKAKKLSLSKKKITMEVGDELTIKSRGKKSDIKVKISPKKANKGIKVITNKRSVVRVKKLNKYAYKLMAEDEGKAKITVVSLSNKKLKKRLNITVNAPADEDEEDGDDVEKIKPIAFGMTAHQIAEDKISVNFTKEVPATITLSNFKLMDKTGNSDVALKNFTLAADKKSAEIQSLINFNIGSVYELSYDNPEDGKKYSAEINAKKGEVKSLKLLTTSVPVNVAKKLNFAVYDTEGVDVTSSYKPYVTLAADIPAGKGFFDPTKNELTMFDTSATAKITMTYQEGAKKVEDSGTVSVTSQSTETVSLVAWNLAQPAIPLDWNNPNKLREHTVGLNTMNMAIAAKVKTSDGKEFNSDIHPGFTFKSSDESVFTMLGTTITPIAKGTANIIVEFKYEGKTSKFTPVRITIGENAKPKTIELSQGSVTVKKGETNDTLKIKFVKDQYGNVVDYAPGTWNFTANPAAGAPAFSIFGGDTIKVDATGAGVVANSYTAKAELTLGGEKTDIMFGTIVIP